MQTLFSAVARDRAQNVANAEQRSWGGERKYSLLSDQSSFPQQRPKDYRIERKMEIWSRKDQEGYGSGIDSACPTHQVYLLKTGLSARWQVSRR